MDQELDELTEKLNELRKLLLQYREEDQSRPEVQRGIAALNRAIKKTEDQIKEAVKRVSKPSLVDLETRRAAAKKELDDTRDFYRRPENGITPAAFAKIKEMTGRLKQLDQEIEELKASEKQAAASSSSSLLDLGVSEEGEDEDEDEEEIDIEGGFEDEDEEEEAEPAEEEEEEEEEEAVDDDDEEDEWATDDEDTGLVADASVVVDTSDALLEAIKKQKSAAIGKSKPSSKGKSKSRGKKSTGATEEQKAKYEKSQEWAKNVEQAARDAYDAAYEEIKEAFFEKVPDKLDGTKWNRLFKKLVQLATSSEDAGALTRRYSLFLTDKPLSTPLSLFEVAFIVSLRNSATPQLTTLDSVLSGVQSGTTVDFATTALIMAGIIQFPGGYSPSVEKRLKQLGLAPQEGTISINVTEGQIESARKANAQAGYTLRNSALDVFTALATVEFQSGAKIEPIGMSVFTGRKRLLSNTSFVIQDGVAASSLASSLFAGVSDSTSTDWPYNIKRASGGKKRASSSASTSSEEPASSRAKRRFRAVEKTLDEAANLREYLSDVLAYIRKDLGEDHPDYKRLLQRVDNYSVSHEQLKEKYATLLKQHEALSDKEKKTQADLDKANTNLRTCLRNLEEALSKKPADTSANLKALQRAEARAESLEKELAGCRGAMEGLVQQLEESVKKVDQLEVEGDRLRAQISELEAVVSSSQGGDASAQERIKTLERRLERATTQAFGLSVGLEPELEQLRRDKSDLERKIQDLENGRDLAQADWRSRVLMAILSADKEQIMDSLFYHRYPYAMSELATLAKLGGNVPVLTRSTKYSSPVISVLNQESVYKSLLGSARRFDSGLDIYKNKIVRKGIRDLPEFQRRMYVRTIFTTFGVPTEITNKDFPIIPLVTP